MEDSLGSVQSVLVLGGGSEIARSIVRRLVADRARKIVLAARQPDRLAGVATELRALGATEVHAIDFDATDSDAHEAFVDECFDHFGDFDLVLFAFGVLVDEDDAARDATVAAQAARVNYLGAVSVGVPVARRMRAQGHGVIVALSSVAGERARRSNFVYGSSKAGMDAFFQGLGDSLVGSGVHVMIVRPGFVHTKMTEDLEPAPLATTPEHVADAVVRGLGRRADTVWVPPVLRYVMAVVRHLPRAVFRKLSI